MRLVVIDRSTPKRQNFYPLALSRPIWELRCGITSLLEKLIARFSASDVACFVPDYLADVYRARSGRRVNDLAALAGDDLLVVDARVKADACPITAAGPSLVVCDADGEVLLARVAKQDLAKLPADSLDAFLAAAKAKLPAGSETLIAWNYTWDLILASPEQITRDFATIGRRGVEGTIEEPSGFRGSKNDLYVGRGAVVHPLAVIDCKHGPVYLDEEVEVHPFTRIEGPCFVGRKSILLGAKCREGNSIGPVCRVGGEVEESIIQGYSNKYHDGFLGHAYVGEWVNLGALTTNSDLKNDYSSVSITLDGHTPIDTGSTKVGSLIGDHTKTSIGVLFNTGAYVGAMCLVATNGRLMPKFLPSFSWYLDGAVTKGFGKKALYDTARTAMGRRKLPWTPADEAMWNEVFKITAESRGEAVKKGRRTLARMSG